MAKVTMESKVFYVDHLAGIDPRYDDINGRTFQDLHDKYIRKYLKDTRSRYYVYDSIFSVFEDESGKYILIYDISKPHDKFFALAIKLGDETKLDYAKVYRLTWEVTNPKIEKADGQFNWADFKVEQLDDSEAPAILIK